MKKIIAFILTLAMITATASTTLAAPADTSSGTNRFNLDAHSGSSNYECPSSQGGGYHMVNIFKGMVLDTLRVTPSAVPETIQGYPVICLNDAFASLADEFGKKGTVIVAPKIPKYVLSMNSTFQFAQIKTPPSIPDSVINMDSCFYGAKQMTTFPEIGNSVEIMKRSFFGCTSVSGAIILPSSVTNLEYAFFECTQLDDTPDISHLENLEMADDMFSGCSYMSGGTDLPDSGLKSMDSMFYGCKQLETPPSVIYSSVTDIASAFEGCNALSGTIDVRATLHTSQKNNYANAFKTAATRQNGEGLVLNYTAQNEAVIDDIIATKLITSNISKGVLLSDKVPETQPQVAIDYVGEKLTGFQVGNHLVNGIQVLATNNELALTDYMDSTIQIVKQGNGSTTENSTAQTLNVPARPIAPTINAVDATSANASDGQIQGVNDTMEYRVATADSWTPVASGTTIAGLVAGSYEVRIAQLNTNFSGHIGTVTIMTAGTTPDPLPDPDGGEQDGTPPIVPDIDTEGNLIITDGHGSQNVIIEGIVEPVNTIDVDVPLKLQFIIDEQRNIHYTTDAKVISRSPAPLNVYSASATVPTDAPKLVADTAFEDWNNLNISQSMDNIAISINNQNLMESNVSLGSIPSAFESVQNLPLVLSVLYGKQWINTSQMTFHYSMNLELALAS